MDKVRRFSSKTSKLKIELELNAPKTKGELNMCKKKKQEREVIVVMEDNTLLVPIDCGMSNLKSLLRLLGEDKFKEYLFGSEVEKGESITGMTTYINDCPWNFGGFKGDSSKKVGEYENVFTKATEFHRALVRRYLYELYLQTGFKKFEVIIAASVDNFNVNKGKNVVSTMLEGEVKPSKFKIREGINSEIELEIVNVIAQPETASALLSGVIKTNATESNLYLCDIGYLNNTVFVIREGRIDFSTEGVEVDVRGMNHIVKHINAYYNRHNLRAKMTANKIEQILKHNRTLDSTDEKLFQQAINEYMDNEYMPKLLARDFNSSYDSLEFIGGGSVAMERFLKKYCEIKNIKVEISKDSMFATVKGMLRKVEITKGLDISTVNGK